MQNLDAYKTCIICDCKYITYEKYKNDDKLCSKCKKLNPLKMMNQNERMTQQMRTKILGKANKK